MSQTSKSADVSGQPTEVVPPAQASASQPSEPPRRTRSALSALVTLGIAGAVVVGLCVIPFPVLAGVPVALIVSPTAATSTRVCPGPLLSVQTRDGDATSFVPFQAPTIVDASTSEPITRSPLAVTGDTPGEGLTPIAVSAPPPADGSPTLLAGAQAQTVAQDDMAGLAASGCLEPDAESWLVGGATNLGQTTLIHLANGSGTDASAHIEIYGEQGRVAASGSNDVVVPAGSEQVVSLASLAPDVTMPVVHVVTSGGSLAATLQQTLVRSIVPSGVEFVEPGTNANKTQVIPGVRLVNMAQFSDAEGGAVASDEEPAVRVLATSAQASDVVISTIATDGTTTQVKSTLAPGTVAQLPFNNVPDGIYTVIVSGTTPVVAGVRSVVGAGVNPARTPVASSATPTPGASGNSSSKTPSPSRSSSAAPTPAAPAVGEPMDGIPLDGGEGVTADPGSSSGGSSANLVPLQTGGDFTWYPAAAALGPTTLVAVASAPVAELTLYNGLAKPVSALVHAEGQSDVNIVVDSGGVVSFEIAPNTVYRLDADAGLRAAVTYSGEGESSASSVRPPSRLGSTILVYPR